MSGPPGPPYPGPQPGSNAIGQFQIGISPIGDIPPFSVWPTIISQYANSPTLTAIILNLFGAIDETANITAFFDNIYNIATAVGPGLDLWGRILNVTRIVQIPTAAVYFSFHEQNPNLPFGSGSFSIGAPTSTNFPLSDTVYRQLLFAKALFNICNGSSAAINQILLALFPNRGNCYVVDNLNLSMTYTFAFGLSTAELAMLSQSGVLPRPSGVSATIVHP